MPTENTFEAFISDVDGIQYHEIGTFLANHFNNNFLQDKYYGGLFPKLVASIYYIFGANPFIITCLNSIISGFISVIVYIIGKNVISDNQTCKIYALLSVFCTSYIVNTSVLMRDVYITFFIYLSIYLSYLTIKRKNILNLFLFFISIYLLYLFRPYAAIIVTLGIISGIFFVNIKGKFVNKKLVVNKWLFMLLVLSPFIIGFIFFGLGSFISNQRLLQGELSVESLIHIRDTAYAVSNSTYSWDFGKMYKIFPLFPFMIGYLCLFLAPFPTEWIYVKRLHFVPDMIILYMLLPSFIKNIKKIFQDRNYFLLTYFFTMLCMFTIYCITVGNSGTIHRLRGPYIPMIYLIALYRPDKFLNNVVRILTPYI